MKTEIGEATLMTLDNKLFWNYDYIDSNKNVFRARWQGEESVYWWTEIEHSDRLRILETNGIKKVFELDHKTNKVYEITKGEIE